MAYYGDHREYEVDISDQRIKVDHFGGDVGRQRRDTSFVACDPAEVVVIADSPN